MNSLKSTPTPSSYATTYRGRNVDRNTHLHCDVQRRLRLVPYMDVR